MPQNSSDMPETDTPTATTAKVPAKIAAAYLAALQGSALPGEGDDMDKAALADASQFAGRASLVRAAEAPSLLLEPMAADGTDRRMRLVIVNDDMPFLVDSTSQVVAAQGLAVHRILHPVVAVKRDGNGHLLEAGEGPARESLIYMELERGDARARRRLLDAIEGALRDVRAAVRDWRAMRAAMLADAAMRVEDEAAELLRWFEGGAMTQLGHEWRTRDGKVQDPLGVSESGTSQLLSPAALDAAFAWFDKGGQAPLLIKSNRLSAVHRRVLLDLVIVPETKGKKVDRLSIHAGLWTSAALSARPDKVPVLRAQLDTLMAKFGFDPAGHAGKALAHALTALPHDLLIAFDAASLEELVLTSMSITDRPRPKLVTVRSALGRHLFVFVWLPRDEVSTGRRIAVEAMLVREAKAGVIGWTMVLEDGGAALLRYTLDLRSGGVVPDTDALNTQLEQMVRGWQPQVEAALAKRGDPGRAAALAARFAPTFPPNYRNLYNPEEAARDILRLRDLDADNPRSVRLAKKSLDGDDRLRLKVYSAVGPLALSDVVPALEHFGFEVLEEIPTALGQSRAPGMEADDEPPIVIHDFTLRLPANVDEMALLPYAEVIEDAIAAVLGGRAENDAFNELVLTNQTDPRAIIWLRAWFRYLRQGGSAYGMDTVVSALRHAPALTAALIERFRALHDPKARDAKRAEALDAEILADFADIKSIDEDRILRLFHAVIGATLRTNAFAPAAEEALAFKIDSSLVPGLPKPLPWREVWVYSPRVEGIHLRAGPVARGGLRWSDRRDDFRTEILGLMKAQRVKNAVIVPTGAKGGFYPKALPDQSLDRDAWFAEGTECYRIFIRSLLSITDNLVAGKVVHPKSVVIHDGDDPYFVVAADKGTATFSDVANALAMERDFWLGDAFASGGSNGYDHKAMGITARGAWLSVQRHFAEMGVDVQNDTIRVVGCGDMSGDVFGNGMLLSREIRLIAAFDHRDIFIDPAPDAEASFVERERMFALPRSSWQDYDKSKISAGGGIFPRSQKSITLSQTAADAIGLGKTVASPAEIMNAILKAPVDLLWFGGIGTYVRATSETNQDAGDRANDAIRVTAAEVRAKAIGEGANLGVTQRARIEYGLLGGRCNSDAIDNSGGVNSSDVEVNIKIALATAMRNGSLTRAARNKLLASMTEEVGQLVLTNNYRQTLAISLAELRGASDIPHQQRFMAGLEARKLLDRKIEMLPSDAALVERAARNEPLTRAELGVLLAYAKMVLLDDLAASPLPDEPYLERDLMEYFPDRMAKKYAPEIASHRLRREIIATQLANDAINRGGPTFVSRLQDMTGCPADEVIEAYVLVRDGFALPALYAEIDALDSKIDGQAQLGLYQAVGRLVYGQTVWFLRNGDSAPLGDRIAALAAARRTIEPKLAQMLPADMRARHEVRVAALAQSGAPAKLAERLALLGFAELVPEMAQVAKLGNVSVDAAAKAILAINAHFRIGRIEEAARTIAPTDYYDGLALSRAHDMIAAARRGMAVTALLQHSQAADPVAEWIASGGERIGRARERLQNLTESGEISLSRLSVAAGLMNDLTGL